MTSNALKTTHRLNASETKAWAYEDIRRKIVRLELAPGENLDENQLVEAYGLSRTPIRELLLRLAGERLVVIRPNRGAQVSPLGVETLQEVFEAGDYLERAIMRLACERRSSFDINTIGAEMAAYELAVSDRDADAMVSNNRNFHEGFAIAARNKYLLQAYRPILIDHERIGQLWYGRDPDNGKINATIIKHHRMLFDALQRQDAEAGEAATIIHAEFCKDGIRNLLSSGQTILNGITIKPQTL